jgi:HNH endonuclease
MKVRVVVGDNRGTYPDGLLLLDLPEMLQREKLPSKVVVESGRSRAHPFPKVKVQFEHPVRDGEELIIQDESLQLECQPYDKQIALNRKLVFHGLKRALSEAGVQVKLPKTELALRVGIPFDMNGLSPEEADWEKSNAESDRWPLVERQIRERRGQRQFRDALRECYGDRCLVTGCEVLAVLEAAHIKPSRGLDDNQVENGLLLRADVHTLFDLDLLGIEPNSLRVKLHPDVVKEYGRLAGARLGCTGSCRPSEIALTLRYKRFSGCDRGFGQ